MDINNTKDLDQALEYLLEEEGGWSNHPADRGGKTMYGVTQAVYAAYRQSQKLPAQSVGLATKQEIRCIYDVQYWQSAGCHKFPWPISYVVFDAAVNSGVSRAVKWLQAGLGLPQDGAVGPKSIAAAQEAVAKGDSQKILGILDARIAFLAGLVRSDTSQLAFLLGWWRRSQRVLARALLSELDS